LQERATAICFEKKKKKKRQSLQAVALISKISWKRSELLVSYRIAIVWLCCTVALHDPAPLPSGSAPDNKAIRQLIESLYLRH
jgi:hypothetical protein